MAYISQITLPSGTTYDIKDAEARALIAALDGTTSFLGVTTTELTDGSTTNPITINSESVTADTGSIATYGSKEFVWNGSAWQEFGDLSVLGSLAFKDSASATYTPEGTINVTLNSTPNRYAVYEAKNGSYDNYVPAGTISKPAIALYVGGTVRNIKYITTEGTLPTLSTSVANECLTISWDAGSLPVTDTVGVKTTDPTYQLATAPTFTGTAANLATMNLNIPTIAVGSFTGTEATITST